MIQHGLNSPIKYVRLLWRELNGKRCWYAQLVCQGEPYQKPKNYVSDGVIGLDLNISNIAFVADNHAGLLPFAENVPRQFAQRGEPPHATGSTFEREIKVLQRKMERSRRANNPDNYEPEFKGKKGRKIVKKKGKAKKGKRRWNNSKTYKKTATAKRKLERRKTAYAKSQNRKVINEILRHGKHVKTEKVSVKGWQKRYGKAISAKSPGFVQSELKRKAENVAAPFACFLKSRRVAQRVHSLAFSTQKTRCALPRLFKKPGRSAATIANSFEWGTHQKVSVRKSPQGCHRSSDASRSVQCISG